MVRLPILPGPHDFARNYDWCSSWDGTKYDLVFYGVSGYTGYLMPSCSGRGGEYPCQCYIGCAEKERKVASPPFSHPILN